ncbi:uncharacterized protein TNCT_206041 [Trichonephila clavata]|uniref:Uncharacterized protein n=1 Tax=Trichonephila clavata TaxID=2740835 RepID=A0A8X6F1Y3_TRICU|nr:uncharacterized protein TNCT_206041 [Trichonephila clavata]
MSQGKSFKEASKYQWRQVGEEIKKDILHKLKGGGGVKRKKQSSRRDQEKKVLRERLQHKTNANFEDYKENTCLYVFDLTQDFSASDPFGNVTRSGDISIHLKFGADLPETATLIAYMEMPSLIENDN